MYDRIGYTSYTGVDDTRLFCWPGRGLYALTGRHDEVAAGSSAGRACGRYNWMQYLVQVGSGTGTDGVSEDAATTGFVRISYPK